MPRSGQLTKVTSSKTRRYIWCVEKGNDYADIGTFYPEDDGYQILSIDQGKYYKYLLKPLIYITFVTGSKPLLSFVNDCYLNFVEHTVKYPHEKSKSSTYMFSTTTFIFPFRWFRNSMAEPFKSYCNIILNSCDVVLFVI